jgi:hypothetical protein
MATARDDEPTCGKGLAANALVPAKFAELLAATAEVLERHIAALEPTDPHATTEREAYMRLVDTHRAIARSLSDLAQNMAGYRDLPMARHDPAVMSRPDGQAAAFQQLVAVERELLELLHTKIAQDDHLLT